MLYRTFCGGLALATSLIIVGGCSTEPQPAGAPTSGSPSTRGGSANPTRGGTSAHTGSTAASGVNAGGLATTGGGTTPSTGGRSSGGTSSPAGGGQASGGATNGGAPAGGAVSSGGSLIFVLGGTSGTGGTRPSGGSGAMTGGSGTGDGGTTSTGGASGTTGGFPSDTGGGSSTTGGTGAGGSTAANLHGCAAAITDATLSQAYQTWKAAYVVDCSTSMARVQAGGNTAASVSNETFSEGIGYGMLLAVALDDRATFDKLWAYYRAHRNAHGLMNWKMEACTGNPYGDGYNGASDGDLDTAMALVMGDRRWGGYTTDANALLDAIRTYETMVCGSLTVLRPGDAWGLECTTGNLNPSYFSPGYYRAFAVYQPDQAAFWTKLADDSISLLLTYQQNAGGALMGEWSYTDRLADTNYGYNACRTPWRVAVDYAWWGTAGAQTFLTNVSSYVDSRGGVASVPFDKNSALLGPFALSGIATGRCDTYYQSWMSGAQYDDRYFQGTLRVLAMLLMAGKFTPPG